MLRSLFVRAGDNRRLRDFATEFRPTRALAHRFFAGEELEDGLAVARELAATGRSVTLDYLGESVTNATEARAAADVYRRALARIGELRLDGGVSVKPTQMGLSFDHDLCVELLESIVVAASPVDAHVTLDMEDHEVTEATVALVEHLARAGHHHVGCAVQAYLHRTPADVMRLNAVGASLRLCKGAYAEPPEIAHTDAAEVSNAFARLTRLLFAEGTYPRLATHDDMLIDRITTFVERQDLSRDSFEFQMLYGVRESLQRALVDAGWRLRVYVPFGDQWYPYFMRRLGERPANLLFFLRALRDT